MHERQNGDIRAQIQRTSKHNPSKYVHKRYGSECSARTVNLNMHCYIWDNNGTSIGPIRENGDTEGILGESNLVPGPKKT
jgi:hypothetical protein